MTKTEYDKNPPLDLFGNPLRFPDRSMQRDFISFGLRTIATANKARLGMCRERDIRAFALAALRAGFRREVRDMATSFLDVVDVDCIAAGNELSESFYDFLEKTACDNTKRAIEKQAEDVSPPRYDWQERADLK